MSGQGFVTGLLQRVLAISIAAGLTACSTLPRPTLLQGAAGSVPQASGGESHIGTLPPRKLAAGECAMFLWLRNAERKLIFFGAREGTGRAVIDGEEVGMKRIVIDGREAFGQYENQTFTYPGHRIQINVGFETRAGMDRGVVVSQGTLRLQQDDGWEYILPVGGLVACE